MSLPNLTVLVSARAIDDSAPPERQAAREVPAPEVLRAVYLEGARRLLDIALAAIALLLLAPVLLLVGVLIKLDSPGPVFFRQERLGRNRAPFRMLKLRTMRDGVSPELHRAYIASAPPAASGELRKLTHDARVTAVGRVLRSTSLDEVPQLLHVLSGRMSIVGPRPAIHYELHQYRPEHFERFR